MKEILTTLFTGALYGSGQAHNAICPLSTSWLMSLQYEARNGFLEFSCLIYWVL